MTPVQVTGFRNHLRSFRADSPKPLRGGQVLGHYKNQHLQNCASEQKLIHQILWVSKIHVERLLVTAPSLHRAVPTSLAERGRHQEPHKTSGVLWASHPLYFCLQKAISTVILLNRFGHPWVRYSLFTISPPPMTLLLYFSRFFASGLAPVLLMESHSLLWWVKERWTYTRALHVNTLGIWWQQGFGCRQGTWWSLGYDSEQRESSPAEAVYSIDLKSGEINPTLLV